MSESLYDYCVRTGNTDLLTQWHPEKNLGLDPHGIRYGSQKRVWWRCGRGHEWQAQVTARTGSNCGCPYCAGKRPWPGESDLASRYPDLARQWHSTKNGGLTPEQILPGSHKLVWWVCEKGHEWQAIVKSRTFSGCGCPVCAHRTALVGENDLASAYPRIAAQWHSEKNGSLTPHDVIPGSRRKVWWQCERGHSWCAMVASRAVLGSGCPVCANRVILPGENDLASAYPRIAAQWHPDKNGSLRPSDVSPYSNRRVWWRCGLGHEWQAIIASRTKSDLNCPYCANRKVLPGFNDLASRYPAVAAQ